MDFGDYEDFEIWLGTALEEFSSLDDMLDAASQRGYTVPHISDDEIKLLNGVTQLPCAVSIAE